MKRFRTVALGFFLAAMLLVLQSPYRAFAQDQDYDDQGQGQDPPSRVARLNYSSGTVSFQPGGEGEWVEAMHNRPMTTGDNLWADRDARAELHVGSTAIRMGSETSLTFLDLDDRTTQLRLSLGSVILRVRHLDDGDLMEVDTPNLAFEIQRVGEYRIDVSGDGNETITTVWHGRAEVTGGGDSYTVVAGQSARFTGTEQLDHEIAQLPNSDDLDNWAFSRDQREDGDESSNYISSEMTGYEDLDDYGHWRYAGNYGTVWAPSNVAADWAPYRNGHWVWVDPWGWTWVEDEPWGFAPFHYGRWAFIDSSWCWVPGPVVVRPVYAPALVAFVGGSGFSVSLGFGGGGVAWFPLGPREVYVPPYRVSRGYVNNVNITNTRVNITEVTNVYNNYNTNNVKRITYVNQRPNAVTAVSRDTFVNARPVARNIARIDERQLQQAEIVHRNPEQPVRASVLGAGGAARVRPPQNVEQRRVVATRTPAPRRGTFDQHPAPVNVRTERPGNPQPAAQGQPGQAGRGQQNQLPRGQEQGNRAEQNPPRPGQSRPDQPPVRGQADNNARDNNGRGQADNNADRNPRANVPRPPDSGGRNNDSQRIPGAQAGNDNRPENNRAPADRGQNNAPRTEQPNARVNDNPRGNDNRQPRPDESRSAPRPERPEPGARAEQQSRPQSSEPASHPLVRQAPPVQERPQQQQNEENKFRTWQQQRPNVPRPQEARPSERPQQQERPQPQARPQQQDKPQPQRQQDRPQSRPNQDKDNPPR